jgi:GNAT superfamily N-acetyltransferase
MTAEMEASDQNLPAGISARPLAAADLEAAMALVTEARWNQTHADWQLFLKLGHAVALTRNGLPIATAAILPYTPRLAWISMVLVAVAERRQGLARWLLRHCVEEIVRRGLVPALDATPAGRGVYLELGFHDTWTMQRFVGRADRFAVADCKSFEIRRLEEDDWPHIIAFDRGVFGVDRSAVLRLLGQRLPQASFVAFRDGRVTGFALGRDGRVMTQLGPVMAEDDHTAIALVAEALSALSGAVAIDVPDRHVVLTEWLAQRGFSIERPFTRMVYQRSSSFDDTAHVFAIAGPEFG